MAADRPRIWPFRHRIVAAGETPTWAPDTTQEAARRLWTAPPRRVHVAEYAYGTVTGSACRAPNHGGPAADIANAAFGVDPDPTGRGGQPPAAARDPAVRRRTALGHTVLGTVPEAFARPRHGRVGPHVVYRPL